MGRGYHMDEWEADVVAGNMMSLRKERDELKSEVERLKEENHRLQSLVDCIPDPWTGE